MTELVVKAYISMMSRGVDRTWKSVGSQRWRTCSCGDAVCRWEARKGDDVCLLTEPETRLAALTIGGY